MGYIIIIVLIVCTYFIIKTIKEHSPEGQKRKLFNKIGSYKKRVMFLRDQIIKRESDLIENDSLQELRDDLIKMDKRYHDLIDRNKTDYNKILEWTEDWNNFLTALHSLKMAECKLVVDLSNETAEKYGELTTESRRTKENIEKKFKNLLK